MLGVMVGRGLTWLEVLGGTSNDEVGVRVLNASTGSIMLAVIMLICVSVVDLVKDLCGMCVE